jgi:hypothetical protein
MVTTMTDITMVAAKRTGKFPESVALLIAAPSPRTESVYP